MKKTLFCAALALVTCAAQAQKMRAPKGGTPISEEFLGIFFEDISYAADGGLNAQLMRVLTVSIFRRERNIIFQLSCVTQLVRQKMCALSFKVSSSSLR